jgi:hypothetical protein
MPHYALVLLRWVRGEDDLQISLDRPERNVA